MLKMFILHHHTSFSLTKHGLTDTLKNARGVADFSTIVWSMLNLMHFLDVPKENNHGELGLVNNLARILITAFLSNAPYSQFQGNFWWCD
jgi:hypothetical protein